VDDHVHLVVAVIQPVAVAALVSGNDIPVCQRA